MDRTLYDADATRVAMREGDTLYYLLGDHLGSTAVTADASGNKVSETRFMPFGADRYVDGASHTSYRYTGQRSEGYINLYWYNSRWYDPALGRWIQPDTIIPDPNNPLDWDRYSYVRNNSLRYTDPTGHEVCDENGDCYERGQIVSRFKSGPTHPEEFFAKVLLRSPLHGEYLYGNYLSGCTTNSCTGLHPGIDSFNDWANDNVLNERGRAIYAASDGVVVRSDVSDWGNYVMVEHDVFGTKFYSIYAHLDSRVVSEGDIVSSGTRVGTMGNTMGEECPGCDIHLHFEIREANNVNLAQGDPFAGMTWWPQNLNEFNQKWVDLSPLLR